MITGPNIITEGLVFGFDADDRSSRFYPGEPTTNTLTYSQDFTNGTAWVGISLVIGTGYLAPDGTYTAQRVSDPTHTNMLYRGGAATNGQVKSIYARTVSGSGTMIVCGYYGESSKYLVTLTEEWKRFSFPVYEAETGGNNFYAVDFRYAGTLNECLIWGAQVETKTHPTQYLKTTSTPVTRTSTQSLIDLKKTTSIDLSNVSFDWTGHPYFYAGGNNYITVGDLGSFLNFTVEIIINSDDVVNYRNPVDCNWLVYNGTYSNIGPRLEQDGTGQLRWTFGNLAGDYQSVNAIASGLLSGKYISTVLTKEGNTFSAYYNGTLIGTGTRSDWSGEMANVTVGRG